MLVKTQALTAGTDYTVGAGTYFRLLSCPTAVDIRFYKDGSLIGEALGVDTGFSVEMRDQEGVLEEFTKAVISSSVTQSVKFGIGYGEIRLDQSNGTVSLVKASSLASTADVALGATGQTLVKAANAARRRILITNLAGNASTIRVGDVNAGAARGTPVAAGETITLETTAAVYAYNPGAGQSVAVLEETD